MKERTSWYSHRVGQEVAATRWGHYGLPVLIFPPAGGDAEEIERVQIIAALGQHLEQGRIKVYSCDGVGGRAVLA